jgi:hypothetical protein
MKTLTTILLSLFLLLFFSCKKDIELTTQVQPEKYSFMQFDFEFLFSSLNDNRYQWKLDPPYYFSQSSSAPIAGEPDNRILHYGFYTNLCDAKIELYTPAYSSKEELLANFLSIGKKEIGVENSKFHINLTQANIDWSSTGQYTMAGDQKDSYFEIMKVKKFFDSVIQKDCLMAWIIFDCKFYRVNDNTSIRLKNGEMIIKVYDY